MASLAAQAIASGTTQNPVAAAKTSASGAASIDAVFASLLAKPDVAPSGAQNSDPAAAMAQSGAAKGTQDVNTQLLDKLGKAKSASDEANDNDANPALAALSSQMNAAQQAAPTTPKSTASAVEALALEKLAKKSSTPGDGPALPLVKAGTPTLPVIAPGDGQGEAAKQASAATGTAPSATDDQTKVAGTVAAALSNDAQQTARLSAPAQVTESQALSVHFDASAAKSGDGQTQNGHSGGGSAHEQTQHADVPASQSTQNAPPVQASAPVAANAAPASAASGDGAAGIANAATAAGATGPATSSNVATVLQVAPQSDSAASTAAQPNLQALAVTIAAKSTDGFKQFDIRLDPPELGRIDVRLSVDSTGKAQAHLAADNVQTLQLLQRDSSTLERSLRDSGLDLANNGLNFSLKGQERQDGDAPKAQTRGRSLSVTAVAAPATSASNYSLAPDGVTLDIRV